MIVVLIGYMASGKSTIGEVLAHKLKYDFIDLDAYIETAEQSTINTIFKEKGEIYFRRLETAYLKDLLHHKVDVVLSLGGGTPCYGNNMKIILNAKHVTSIYLKASIPTLVERLKNEKSKRPLIAHIKTDALLLEFIGKHLFERNAYYSQAQKIISTDNKDITEITEEIISNLL